MTQRTLVAGLAGGVWAVVILSAAVGAQIRKTVWDKVFTAEQAVAYGLADLIISSRQPALARPA